ncbi:hypothetical protein UT300019_17310 [Clostridium sp. CTA-19]
MRFDDLIKKAIIEIKNENFLKATEYIHLAISEDDNSAKPHNLLGIIEEINGNLELANNHYRSAYSLDPTFKASDNNLKRITSFYYVFDLEEIDFGETIGKQALI